MSVSEETIREELEWQEKVYDTNKGHLDDDPPPGSRASYLDMVGGAARDIGICLLPLSNHEKAKAKFSEAVEYYLSFTDAITEHADAVDGAEHAQRPTHYKETINVAVLTNDGELILQAVRHPLDFDDEQYLAEWGDWEFHHVLYYVKALAHTLDDELETARSYLEKLDAVNHDHGNYDALHDALLSVVESDRDAFIAGLSDLLAWHDDAYGHDLSTATHFVCVDATALLVLARREGMDVGPEDFEEELRAYLPEVLFE